MYLILHVSFMVFGMYYIPTMQVQAQEIKTQQYYKGVPMQNM